MKERGFEAGCAFAAALLEVEALGIEPTVDGCEGREFVAGTLTTVDLLQTKTEIAIREHRIAVSL